MKASNNFNTPPKIISVLVCPLDWGLGHATRCIPIIKHFIEIGCTVTIAADGNSLILLKNEFPQLRSLNLPGYNIQYSRLKKNLKWKLFVQIPKIINTIVKEHQWLKKQVIQHHFDLIISDNRFGLYHKKITSVYITHQLLIKTGNSLLDKVTQKLHYFFIKKFHHCWVPDAKENGLGGTLSHPNILPSNITYIGPVSRFVKSIEPVLYDLIIILSGPEPQRSILETKLITNLSNSNIRVLLIRGIEEKHNLQIPVNWQVRGLVNATELNILINNAQVVLCRAGYSSIMDLVKLQKQAVIIPTPGQTEQEYLAGFLSHKKIFLSFPQNDIPVLPIVDLMRDFPFSTIDYDWNNYKFAIHNLAEQLKTSTVKI